MNHLDSDLQQLENILNQVLDQGVNYLNDLNNRPTVGSATVTQLASLNVAGLGTIETLKQFNARFEPAMVASSGPRYWGFVTGGTTPAAIAGDWLATVYDQNTQSAKGNGRYLCIN